MDEKDRVVFTGQRIAINELLLAQSLNKRPVFGLDHINLPVRGPIGTVNRVIFFRFLVEVQPFHLTNRIDLGKGIFLRRAGRKAPLGQVGVQVQAAVVSDVLKGNVFRLF